MLDGSNSSDTREATLSTRRVRFLIFTQPRILKTDKSSCGTNIMDSTSNGISSM